MLIDRTHGASCMTLLSVHSFRVNGINMFHIGTGTLLFGATVEWIPATVPVQFPSKILPRYWDQINIEIHSIPVLSSAGSFTQPACVSAGRRQNQSR
jgi:hypothetical protein